MVRTSSIQAARENIGDTNIQMPQLVESSLEERVKHFYFAPSFVIQNNTSNSCLTDVHNIHLN